MFGPKVFGPFEMLEVVNNNLIIDVDGEKDNVEFRSGESLKV